jgi:hypothetical protein
VVGRSLPPPSPSPPPPRPAVRRCSPGPGTVSSRRSRLRCAGRRRRETARLPFRRESCRNQHNINRRHNTGKSHNSRMTVWRRSNYVRPLGICDSEQVDERTGYSVVSVVSLLAAASVVAAASVLAVVSVAATPSASAVSAGSAVVSVVAADCDGLAVSRPGGSP